MAGKAELLERASRVLAGGVNSPVRRLYKPPIVAVGGEGPYIVDAELGRLVDHVLGYGPLILGHRHPEVAEAVAGVLEAGWLYGALTEAEVELAEKVLSHVYPGGKIRFVNTGTEATMLAVRLARAYTGRSMIVKFNGAYHGAHDYVLVAAGSAASHLGVPSSPGVPGECSRLTLVVDYNDVEGLERVFEEHGGEIAAVLVEPVLGNYGVVPPARGFLEAARRLTQRHGSLLVFDEVITGFRLSLGGAQEYYGVRADLVTLGKILGGGFPVGAVAGRSDIVGTLTPEGKVFNAGTFNGHPASMAAGLATLRVLEREGLAAAVEAARAVEDAVRGTLDSLGATYALNRVESMLQFYLGVEEAGSPRQVARADKKAYEAIHEEMARRGVLIPPSQLEAQFTSIVHGEREAEAYAEAFREAARRVLRG